MGGGFSNTPWRKVMVQIQMKLNNEESEIARKFAYYWKCSKATAIKTILKNYDQEYRDLLKERS